MQNELPEHRRVLHIAPTPFFSDRGCHIRIAGIVRSMAGLGLQNRVVTYHLGADQSDIETYRIKPIRAYQKTSAGPSIHKILADYRLLRLTLAHVRLFKPAALHAHLHEGVLIAWLSRLMLRRQKDLPIIADMQGSLVGELETYGFFNKIPFLKFPFRTLEKFLLGISDQIVCSSEHALNKFNSEFPESAGKMRLAQDGADNPQTMPEQQLKALRVTLGIDTRKMCVVYSGALLESKGVNHLMSLINQCRHYADHLHFLIVGYPVEELQEYLREHSLTTLCTLTGRVDFKELNQFLAIADVAIDTKKSDAGEGSGKMLNYLANSLPVIAFNTENNIGFLGSDTTLCDTVEEMAARLMHLSNHPHERPALGKQNFQRFQTGYSWDVTRTQLAATYDSLALLPAKASSEPTHHIEEPAP